jgi:hypothetical protein
MFLVKEIANERDRKNERKAEGKRNGVDITLSMIRKFLVPSEFPEETLRDSKSW